jgi:hypothetical protein
MAKASAVSASVERLLLANTWIDTKRTGILVGCVVSL